MGTALIGMVIQFIAFKFLYPFPDFFSDSYSYIYAAYAHLDVNIWPIGYSKFLAAFHELTHSDTALVGFQYFFLEISALYFYFTWSYFFRPGRNSKIILFCSLFFNPLFLYISNYVNSDPLFAALSLWWFTELIWIINRPRLYQVLTQGVLLFFCFTVRNNAYIYPFITILAFLLSRQRIWIKVAGILLAPALISFFVLHTRSVAKEVTGTAQFSLFTGWQLANNVLYYRDKLSFDSKALPTVEDRIIDSFAVAYFRHFNPGKFHEYLNDYVGNYFIREPEAPLKKYFLNYYKPKSAEEQISSWGSASAIYNAYAQSIIRKYPFAYAKYFMLLNAKNYLLPPLEKLELYNLGESTINLLAARWFNYKGNKINVISYTIQGRIMQFFPSLFLAENILFFLGIPLIIKAKRDNHSFSTIQINVLILFSSFILLNAIFSVMTTIVVFRYEVLPLVLLLACITIIFNLESSLKTTMLKK